MGDGSITSCQDQCLTTAELQSCDLKNQFGSDRFFCQVNLRTFPMPFPCHPGIREVY